MLRLILKLRHQFPDCQGSSVPYQPGHGRQWGLPAVLVDNPKCLDKSSPHHSLCMINHLSASHCPNHKVNLFRITYCLCKGLKPRLMSDHQPKSCEFSPLAAAVPSCFQASAVIPPTLTLQTTGAATGMEVGAFGESTFSLGPSITHISRDSGLVATVFLCCK